MIWNLEPQNYSIEDSEDGQRGVATLVTEFIRRKRKETDVEWPTSDEEWLAAQTQDEYCQILLDKLVDDQCRVNLRRGGEDYFYREKLHDGTIGPIRRRYFSEEESRHHKTSVKREMKHEQIVVPKQLVRQCIRFHQEGLAHPGRAKTTQVIQMSYYWPTIRRDCSNYLHQCHYCAARKAHNLRARVAIMQYDRPVRLFYRMHMDLTGRLNTTVGGME